MNKPKRKRIFISHSERDRSKVELLKAQLHSFKDIDAVWVDELPAMGKTISEKIDEQINASSMVLVVLGDKGISKWQQYEINQAKERNIPVVGVSSYRSLPDENIASFKSAFDSLEIPSVQWSFEKLQGVLTGQGKSLSYESPLAETLNKPIQIDFQKISLELMAYLSKHPDELHKLSPRKFEELVAFLMEQRGYEVTLTQQSKDGGVDIFALRKDEIGNFLTLIECKKYAPNRPVGVGIVRSMYGVLNVENASHGVIATTSTFTSGAKVMARQYQYQLSLKDHADILEWMKL